MTILINKLYLSFVLFLWVILLLMVFPWQAYAATQFNYSGNTKIEASIATNELNRIGVVGGEIIEVIGDENKYAIYWSGDWRNLFIKPKVEVGETISLSLIMPGGQAQDIRFTALDMASQTILLNLNKATSSSVVTSTSLSHVSLQLKSEMTMMMRAMIEGEKGKYYVMDVKRVLRKTKGQLITQSTGYRYGDLRGAILSVKNLTSGPLTLHEEEFDDLLKNTIAITIGSNMLQGKASTQLFIITREVHHDK